MVPKNKNFWKGKKKENHTQNWEQLSQAQISPQQLSTPEDNWPVFCRVPEERNQHPRAVCLTKMSAEDKQNKRHSQQETATHETFLKNST